MVSLGKSVSLLSKRSFKLEYIKVKFIQISDLTHQSEIHLTRVSEISVNNLRYQPAMLQNLNLRIFAFLSPNSSRGIINYVVLHYVLDILLHTHLCTCLRPFPDMSVCPPLLQTNGPTTARRLSHTTPPPPLPPSLPQVRTSCHLLQGTPRSMMYPWDKEKVTIWCINGSLICCEPARCDIHCLPTTTVICTS